MAEPGRGSVMPIVDIYAHGTYTSSIQTEQERHMMSTKTARSKWGEIELRLCEMTVEELLELRAMVDMRIDEAELRERRIELGIENPAEEPAAENGGGEKSKAGYLELKTINGCGPYVYRRARVNGRLTSEYVGKVKQ